VVPEVSGVGGMVSFRDRLQDGLMARGIAATRDIRDEAVDAVLVIGGTRDLPGLWHAKRRGVRLVQRLNGMNWLHRHLKTGLRHYLRSEYGNLLLNLIRTRFADHIVYQSAFARDWWIDRWGFAGAPDSVVHNGVDLEVFTPKKNTPERFEKPDDRYRVLLVEGSLMGGYDLGLEISVSLLSALNQANRLALGRPVELVVAGRVPAEVKERWQARVNFPLKWAGLVPSGQIPELDRSAHILYSADINAACPNAVVEALACGTPVLAFDTGALPELVTPESGRIVPYGGDPWKLEKPDLGSLVEAGAVLLNRQDEFRPAARLRAENAFGLDKMVASYLSALYLT
jgi:glycosyltransferase involved in cell wall biosynthesis